MIDLTKVRNTRDGYEVHSIRYYPENREASRLLVDIEYEGEVSTEPYYETGDYYKDNKSGMDLVEFIGD